MDSTRKRTFSSVMDISPDASFGGNSAHATPTTPASNNTLTGGTSYQVRFWNNIEEDYPIPEKRYFAPNFSTRARCESFSGMNDSTCFVCSKSINDEFIYKTAPNIKFHRGCLRCEECGRLLDEDYSCFVQSSKIYCKSDYTRLFAGKCVKCKRSFVADDSIMRINSCACHSECFSCDLCLESISFGDEFVWTGEKLLCKKDWQSHVCEIDQRKQTSIKSGETKSTVESETKTDNESTNPQKKPKTTRVRTVLNEKQLQTLRSCYNNNPRPDALMKEQLCEMTGLTPRVIRVWFQNKRCKDKKRSLMIKQLQEQERLREMGRTALPMIAASPITNELAGGHIGPVDITSYHHLHHHHHHWRPVHPHSNATGFPQQSGPMNSSQDLSLLARPPYDHYYATTTSANNNTIVAANGIVNSSATAAVNQQQQLPSSNMIPDHHANYGMYPGGDLNGCYDDLNQDSHLR